MNRYTDLAGSVAFALGGLGIVLVGLTYRNPTVIYDAIGPAGFPLFIGTALFSLGVYQSLRTVSYIRDTGAVGIEEGTPDEEDYPASGRRAAVFIAGTFIYIALLEPLGYLPTTTLAIFFALSAMRYRQWQGRLVVSLCFTLLGFALFAVFLSVPLPQGIFADTLVNMGIIDYL